ncbi:hypothetical protein [Cellulosimicrobium marinum]|uniref:hypothetical protein n=1 Tax=Cellulosimicrobium marinum TaxID=1638992 RepID=UPI001E581640|nr:hypothetical protein [Cellulosimicrobium marinum]MCB7136074.1 hypothetical protein [Cellulosimicrobium marinum]
MTSYRVSLAVGLLRPGADPVAVLPAAVEAARVRTTVEAYDVGVVRGEARVTVRFLADGDDAAREVAGVVVTAVRGLAATSGTSVARRMGARWRPVRPPGHPGDT